MCGKRRRGRLATFIINRTELLLNAGYKYSDIRHVLVHSKDMFSYKQQHRIKVLLVATQHLPLLPSRPEPTAAATAKCAFVSPSATPG